MAASTAIYDRTFWSAYAAHALVYIAHALTFRLADFIGFLGGSATDAGSLIGAGLIAAIAVRLLLGHLIDRVGIRLAWLTSTVLYLAGNAVFIFADSLDAGLYIGRALFAVGYAGMLACSFAFIQSRAPRGRTVESVAILGQATFVGAIVGSFLGDWLLSEFSRGAVAFRWLFSTIALLGLCYGALVVVITARRRGRIATVVPPIQRIGNWPWRVLFVALVLGAQFAIISFFLGGFLAERGLFGLGPFFAIYCLTAFGLRSATRRWLNHISPSIGLGVGLAALVAGELSFLLVQTTWHLILPAVLCAAARALIEPTLISLGGAAFGAERGSGTALILTFIDVGIMLGSPVFGALIDNFGGAAPFATCAAAGVVAAFVARPLTARVDEPAADSSTLLARSTGS